MAYTGLSPIENDDAADMLAELQRKKNAPVLPAVFQTHAEDCLNILLGRKAKSYVEKENIEALLANYGTAEKISAEFGIESDEHGFYIAESKSLAANRAVLFAWLLISKESGSADIVISKKLENMISRIPFDAASSILLCLDRCLTDPEVVSEWLSALGQKKIDAVVKLQETLSRTLWGRTS